ncbi:hypothetical protein AGMMS49525_00040 [Bacteroidia bacterium]|nr:hypothetical protein AGMMS49525_00040 [Bacteroidia bacterium]
MKKIIKYLFAVSLFAGFATACNDDFMQRDPTQDLAEGGFLTNEGDLPIYLNQLYDMYIKGHQRGSAYDDVAPFGDAVKGSPIIFGDLFSDNMVKSGSANARLNESFQVPSSGTGTGWSWTNLKAVNYFLRHYRDAEGSVNDPAALNKWAAEAYFFKAWDYYQKVVIFGEVPWYQTDLNVNSPELFAPRTPRAELMDSVLNCINFAVAHIQPASGERASFGRINKDMANFLKARICLFEGTFRKYHTELGLQATADKWLQEAETACEEIIATNRYELYNTGTTPYWKLFTLKQDPAADGNKEAILARTYGGESGRGHGTQRYYVMNDVPSGRFAKGATRSLVDEYLCADGKPISTSPLFKGYDGDDWRELDDRDPRLTQTVNKPGEGQTVAAYPPTNNEMNRTTNGLYYPVIRYTQNNEQFRPGTTVTGYWIRKHWMCDKDEFEAGASQNGTQTAVVFRYGEVLLMLAEAKAELRTLTDADLDRTINKLRERAGYDFSTYPDAKLQLGNIPADTRLDAIYAEKLDYSVTPLLREIRRERRVEMAMEGVRYEDLMRWKAGKLLTVPLRGMKFNAAKKALYDGRYDVKTSGITARKAIIDTDVFIDADSFLIVYPRDPRVVNGTLPWDDKRYYWPIPKDQLELNKNLTQTWDWEDISR